MIYFDNAATTGTKPLRVVKTVEMALEKYSANPGRSGHNPSMKVSDSIFKTREKVANFFGASGGENVIFTLNCTHSINYVLKGVLGPHDRVLTSSLEHNAVMRPLVKIGNPYDIASVSLFDDDETIKNFREKIKPDTKLVICTGASNVCGKILPISEIGKLCKEKGILFCVDAAQTAGVVPINMKEMNIDFLCVAPHKGLYAPMGIGLLICEKTINNTLIEGGTGTNSLEFTQPDFLPEKLESGTVNVSGIFGVSAGIDYVANRGIKNIYNHEIELCRHLYRGLVKNDNIELYTPELKTGQYVPVVAFNYKDIPSNKVAEILNKYGFAVRGGFHCAPTAHSQLGTLKKGCVRVSVSIFNNIGEISKLIMLLKDKKIFKNI